MIVYTGDAEDYIMFIPFETYRAVKEWMNFREQCGEKIWPVINPDLRNIVPTSPLS